MRDATDKSVDEAASERNRLRTVRPSEKTAGEKSSSKLAQFFRPSFSSGFQPGGEHDVVNPAS